MADTGALSPQTMADDATVGTVAWNGTDEMKVEDDVTNTTISVLSAGNPISHYAKATNFGFAIPTGATINGILVEIRKMQQTVGVGNIINDNEIKIVKSDGTIGTTNKANSSDWSATLAYVSYGSSSDLWGETWTYSDINDVDFGVVFSAKRISGSSFLYPEVDHIRITVYYTEATTYNSPFPSFRRI